MKKRGYKVKTVNLANSSLLNPFFSYIIPYLKFVNSLCRLCLMQNKYKLLF